MEICINGVKADIILENEKTVGEILAAMEQWLSGSEPRYSAGFRLSGLSIDGQEIGADSLEAAFARDVASVALLDISITSLAELTFEALAETRRAIDEFESLDFPGKQAYADKWKASPAAAMFAQQSPDLYGTILGAFSGTGLSAAELSGLICERQREQENPLRELKDLKEIVAEIAGRLEELPLDIQTGKDRRALETVRFFSGTAGKVFRIFNVLKTGGFPVAEIRVGEISVADYIGGFNTAIKELLAAYETRDTVLVGDLAEYELAPRLRELYAALNAPFTEAA